MAFYQSPGVYVVEKDFSTIVPGVSTTIGGIVGDFPSGPIGTPKLVTSQAELLEVFGKPTKTNYPTWWTAASFLQYANKLYVVNVSKDNDRNATATGVADNRVVTRADFDNLTDQERTAAGTFIAKVASNTDILSETGENSQFLAGNNFGLMVIDNGSWSKLLEWETANLNSLPKDKFNKPIKFSTVLLANNGGKSPLRTAFAEAKTNLNKTYIKDEVFVVVYNKNTLSILEVFTELSKFGDAKVPDPTDKNKIKQTSAYWSDYINNFSRYIWVNSLASSAVEAATSTIQAWGISSSTLKATDTKTLANLTLTVGNEIQTYTLSGAVAASGAVTDSDLLAGYDLFANVEEIDVSLLLTSNYSDTVVKYVAESIAFQRKDAMCFASLSTATPTAQFTMKGSGGRDGGRGPIGTEAGLISQRDTIAVSDSNGLSSFMVIDSGFKQIIDRYQDGEPLVWIPLNGDIAGLCARTEWTNDAWWSPAGFNRGGILNCIKVSYNPNLAQRDMLYTHQINPVVSFPGQGTILYGDKTAQTKPSAFDRINVRRLFIILEKAIATAAKYSLFEFNDSFTRNQFKNMVEPFLRDIQGRRGIQDFLVVCDESNNTGEVIDRNEFVAAIYLKPARSINFIKLEFVATRSGIDFSSVIGG